MMIFFCIDKMDVFARYKPHNHIMPIRQQQFAKYANSNFGHGSNWAKSALQRSGVSGICSKIWGIDRGDSNIGQRPVWFLKPDGSFHHNDLNRYVL